MKGALSATRRPLALLAGGLLALGLVSAVSAQEGDSAALDDIISAVDTAWLLIAGFLVFFMQAGFAMLTAGFVRAKETANILMKNMIDACVGGLSFWLVGWAFAYGAGDATNDFIGLGNFALNEFDGYADWFFQFAFAAVAATIVAGALAGRHEVRGLSGLHGRHHRPHLSGGGALGLGREHLDGCLHGRSRRPLARKRLR